MPNAERITVDLQSARPLTRAALAEATGTAVTPAPVRIVHVGLGAFHRAHQAWYTAQVDEENQWGIAAFTGRSPAAAEQLAPQDGLFSLIERSAEGDSVDIVTSIVEAHDGSNLERFAALISLEQTAIITLTITETGYHLDAHGSPDWLDADVRSDLELLRTSVRGAANDPTSPSSSLSPPPPPLRTALARILFGLDARRRLSGVPIAVVPCDNMPNSGPVVANALRALAAEVDADLAAWVVASVSVISTSVDRITPQTTAADLETARRLTGWQDRAVVVTEPFRDWILSGDFPAGRPHWENAGARFVSDISPFESRKLWLLNGAHSLLAYTAPQQGHETVADAVVDERCLTLLESFWAEASRHLPRVPGVDLDLDSYRTALLDRFRNPRIEHRLDQIANEAVAKLRVRIVPVLLAERAAGRSADAGIGVIAGWIQQVLPGGLLATGKMKDASAKAIRIAAGRPRGEAIHALAALLDNRLATDDAVLGDLERNLA